VHREARTTARCAVTGRTGATRRHGLTGAPFSHSIVAMTSRISHTTVDAIDAYAQPVWWSTVLDFIEDAGDPNEPGHELCPIMSRDRSQVLLFITVPDGEKKLRNRLHFDLRPVDGTREFAATSADLDGVGCRCDSGR
jgi:hypothetical protein